MNTKASSQSGTTGKEEESIENVKNDDNQRMSHEAIVPCCRNEVEERQHAEDGNEDVVIDGRRVARDGLRDHGTDESHDDESEEELRTGQSRIQTSY